jgi:hypothetical protein
MRRSWRCPLGGKKELPGEGIISYLITVRQESLGGLVKPSTDFHWGWISPLGNYYASPDTMLMLP